MNAAFRLGYTALWHIISTIKQQDRSSEAEMITRIAIATLAVSVLGAGAFAFSPTKHGTAQVLPRTVTVIHKNQTWPLKNNMSMDPCKYVACQEV